MDRRALACCRHNLRRLAASPRIWALLILAFLCFDRTIAPIRDMMIANDVGVSWPALMVFLMNDSWISVLMLLGLLVLLFDVPHTDESQKYLLLRSGRSAWARGQLASILCATTAYLIALCLMTLIWIAPHLEWTTGWSGCIEMFVDGADQVFDSMLSYDPWLLRAYSPLAAFALEFALHDLCFTMLAFLMCLVNAAVGSRAGFLIAAAPAMFDLVVTDFFSDAAYYFSPLSLTRLSCLDYGDGRHCPPVGYAFAALAAATALLGLLFVRVYGRKEIHS